MEFIHTAHRAALASLPVCKEVLVLSDNGRQKEADKWIQEEGEEEGREGRGDGNREREGGGEGGIMVRRSDFSPVNELEMNNK